MTRLHPVMLAGTASDVGKSVLATALCRIFKQDGYHPAPFKAQNMALNSFVTPDGLEIGRSQAVQAEAACVQCETDMNPILLKPTTDCTSQVVLNGRPIGNSTASTYFCKDRIDELRTQVITFNAMLYLIFLIFFQVCAAFDRLTHKYNPIVMEGAGSVSELNLQDRDLVNMPMARHAQADVFLVADINLGGVFASLYGSIALQQPIDRRLIKGIIVNKFRGDIRLFDSGVKMLEEICGVPVLGVIPFYRDIYIEEEDCVQLQTRHRNALSSQNKINVAVILMRHLSNFTDFDSLERDPRVHLFYTNNVSEIQKAHIILLPGTKNTIDDLREIRANGVAKAIVSAYRDGNATVLGICGGYQLMGKEVRDPNAVESDIRCLPGLSLLPVTTTMNNIKTTCQTKFKVFGSDQLCSGYEIHNGITEMLGEVTPLNILDDGTEEGCYVAEGRCMGTYIHGILDNAPFIDLLLKGHLGELSKKTEFDYAQFKEEQYDKLAAHLREHLNVDLMYQILKGSCCDGIVQTTD
ncbi:unnamed protein product [Anisakis simplex]|uniref:GATase cobBQ-type domain-containing protein n=1 Tax=Anisakis simplex TaxID=6269 RepID=A0A0M3JYU3_ANISI|nr:unnamed protein product [Anisakis simplex]